MYACMYGCLDIQPFPPYLVDGYVRLTPKQYTILIRPGTCKTLYFEFVDSGPARWQHRVYLIKLNAIFHCIIHNQVTTLHFIWLGT